MGLTTALTTSRNSPSRLARTLITIAVVAALCWPAIRDRDSFPLSTYPMYATSREDTTVFTIANGLTPSGERVPLGLSVIGASDDPLIVSGELRAAVGLGEAETRCEEIADRAARALEKDQIDASIVTVEIASEEHRTIDATSGKPSLVSRNIHATCPISIAP